jgi:hypothetical protein
MVLDIGFHLDFQANFFLENPVWQRPVSCFIWEDPLLSPRQRSDKSNIGSAETRGSKKGQRQAAEKETSKGGS